jgi:predicted negative regulator of RcsB-dependent stress response
MIFTRVIKRYVIVLGGMMLVPSLASAFNFVPTEAEFMAWPDYCRVAYVNTNVGKSTSYRTHVTRAEEISAKRVLGDTSFGGVGVHHYCAGMTLLSRAKIATDSQRRMADLDHAQRETAYTLERTKPDHHMYSAVATQMALIEFEQGNEENALALLGKVIAANPGQEMAYTAKASIYYRSGQYDLARDILEQGDESLG